ncbi:hypothetical protein DUI87_04935 [Hirundo rustica rustica]|uniref:CCHC-type domain-containing protein n=1 Tax=Hirundo rustica rustica TaxID=333673 RepID=A0A3M0KZ51_HIRRU|nr:hypothetical protein DUI87_04935 [Hirundo rustica rustica]
MTSEKGRTLGVSREGTLRQAPPSPDRQGRARRRRNRQGRGVAEAESVSQGATPTRQTSQSSSPPTSGSLAFDSPACGDSNTAAAFLQMGARPKLSQILQVYPELESLLKTRHTPSKAGKETTDPISTASQQMSAVDVSSLSRGGTVKSQTRRASITPSEAPFSSETATLHRFFPVSYKKSTSSEQQFKQKPREPLPMVRDDEAAEEDLDMSITDDNIIHITASEGIPVRKAKALEFSCQASSFLLSKDFMRQFFWQFSEAASEFQHDPMSSFSRIFLPRKGAAEKFADAQQSLVPVLQEKEKEKETKQDEVQPQKRVDHGKDEAAAKLQTQHIATILGDQVEKAIKDAFANFQQRQCYKCGKQGHFKKDCPELAEIASSLDVCPKCLLCMRTLL